MIARSFGLRIAQPMLAALCAALFALAALAQDVAETPARVGRVALVDGKLFHTPPGGADAWTEIGVNVPIAEGDDLWTDAGSLAEVDYGGGQFRLAGQTNLHVSRLDDHEFALFIASGSVIVRVRYLEAGDRVIVDTPSTQAALARPGLYRLDVNADPPETTLVVRLGQADVTTVRGTEAVYPGEIAVLAGTSDVTVDIGKAGGIDLFDTWSAQRDRVYERRDAQYVSPQMVGAYDLDDYGTWQRYPEYGAVWFPTVDPDWAPYRFGQWMWLRDYGYAWVDNAPWGYAPFHYGRWAYIGGRWGWCPGAYVRRPAWAPALVVWYGGPSWTHVAGGAPLYGWVPLGWGEAYVPSWRGCASRCYARYNRPYAVDVSRRVAVPPSRPVNLRAPGGITAVPAPTLASGRPVPINRVNVSPAMATIPPALAAPPAVAPIVAKPLVRPGGAVPPPTGAIARTAPGVARAPLGPAGAPSAMPLTRLPATAVPRAGAPMTSVPPATTPSAATVPAAPQPPTPGGLRVAPRSATPAPGAPATPTAPLRAVPPPAAAPAPLRVPAAPAPSAPSLPLPATPTLRSAPSSPAVPQPLAPPPRIAPGPPSAVPAPVAPAPPAVVPRPAPPPVAPASRPVAPPPPTGG